MLYNEERPVDLSGVKGQKNVIESLGYQAEQGKFSHAYLFYGHRGTGKTTIARILARAVNCEHPTKEGPCHQCAACQTKDYLDYLELDAASNNGVDQIKDLINGTRYRPASMKKKVYVIDEVHMLSTAAFNALLKTLEEPPEYCVFILCTTEFHKIPPTIVSRCESYFFESIPIQDMIQKMTEILKAKEIPFEPEALRLIAKNADGSLRDALSILEQIILCAKEGISAQKVRQKLSLLPEEVAENMLYDIFCYQTKDLLKAFQKLSEEGQSLRNLLDELLVCLSELIVCSTTKEGGRYEVMLRKTNLQRLFWLVEEFSRLRDCLRNEANPYLRFYLELIKVSNPEILQEEGSYLAVEIAELRQRITALESNQSPSARMEEPEETRAEEGEKGGEEQKSREPEEDAEPEDIEESYAEEEEQEPGASPYGNLFDLM